MCVRNFDEQMLPIIIWFSMWQTFSKCVIAVHSYFIDWCLCVSVIMWMLDVFVYCRALNICDAPKSTATRGIINSVRTLILLTRGISIKSRANGTACYHRTHFTEMRFAHCSRVKTKFANVVWEWEIVRVARIFAIDVVINVRSV